MEAHRAMKQREIEERGVDPTEADFATRRAFGSVALNFNRARDVWMWPWLQDVSQDVRFGLRLLVKDRWFTLAVLVALALGLGASTTMFSFMNGYVIGDLPFHDPDHIVSLGTRDARGRDRAVVSYLDFEDWREVTHAFVAVSLFFQAGTPSPSVATDSRQSDSPDPIFPRMPFACSAFSRSSAVSFVPRMIVQAHLASSCSGTVFGRVGMGAIRRCSGAPSR
jgi:hypothetical protein